MSLYFELDALAPTSVGCHLEVEKIKKEAAKLDDDAAYEARELANTRLAFLLREEQTLKKREQKLHSDRVVYRKQAKTFHSQEASRWRGFPCMGKNNQYQLLNMLGKGGFSEARIARQIWPHRSSALAILGCSWIGRSLVHGYEHPFMLSLVGGRRIHTHAYILTQNESAGRKVRFFI